MDVFWNGFWVGVIIAAALTFLLCTIAAARR